MTITIKKTGGFAGIEESIGSIDTADLAPEQSARVRETVVALEQLHASGNQPIGADFMRYEIDVRDGDDTHHLVFVDDADPDSPYRRPLEALLEEVVGR